jgi:alkaline phosphatase D
MSEKPRFTRRTIVKGITASSLLPLLGGNLAGCSDSSDRLARVASVPADFNHGVASGDPLSDSVILWTRATPEREGTVVIDWELAADDSFDDILASGSDTTNASVDYTFKVDAQGLAAGTDYYYRFKTGDKVSATGITRTAPTGALGSASFAVVSCANYPAGYFHVYRDIASRDVDAVLHLGDYIYEYASDGYASEVAEELGRVSEPAHELLSLEDYRTRYAQYHSDMDLQACHEAHPFIVVWDDHEIADNTWKDGAENHDPDTEGDFSERRAAAIQAWYEWLPVRPPANEREIIYRRHQYGDLLDLLMLDTRNVGRDQQVDYNDHLAGEAIDVDSARAAIGDSSRSLLGRDQLDWLKGQLTDSTARWQVLGQQVIMARLALPEPLTRGLALGGSLEQAVAATLATAAAKNKPPEERTPEEQALLDSAIPLNTDAWDGYDFEREDLLNHVAQLQSRLVVLSGDSHNTWVSQLTTADGTPVGVEFGGSSISSPGVEQVAGADNAAVIALFATNLVDDLNFTNLADRGYLLVSFTAEEVSAKCLYVSSIVEPDYTIKQELEKNFVVPRDTLLLG